MGSLQCPFCFIHSLHVILYTFLCLFTCSTRTVGEEISQGPFVVGSLERVWETSTLMNADERAVVGAVSKMWVFRRAIVNGLEIQSSLYKKTTARNNFTVIFQRNGKNHYGSVLKYVKYAGKCTRISCAQLHGKCSCTLPLYYIALVKKMARHTCQLPSYQAMKVVRHLKRVSIADNIIAVPISSIKEKCKRIDIDEDTIYMCHIPNSFEKD